MKKYLFFLLLVVLIFDIQAQLRPYSYSLTSENEIINKISDSNPTSNSIGDIIACWIRV